MAHPKPRKWFPKNPDKYVGDVSNIIARSSWEIKFLNHCDRHPDIIKYASEELIIPYLSPVDGKEHRYFVDFVVMLRNSKGEIKKYAVEIKPYNQTLPPVKKTGSKRASQQMINESITYAVNQAKWNAAKKFCSRVGLEFIVLTERDLYNKKS